MEHHALQYVELAAHDLERVRSFYEQAFGWSFVDYDGYLAFSSTHADGGFYEGEVKASSILPILYSDDLDKSLAAVEAAGGSIEKAVFSFPGGRRFEFSDSEGNRIGVWSELK